MEKNRDQQIISFLEDKISLQERESLTEWRNIHPDHEKQFQEVKFLWQKSSLVKKLETPLTIDTDAALKKVHQHLSTKAKVVPFRRQIIRFVAAASILLLIGFFSWNIFLKPVGLLKITTVEHETIQITLPDESIVWLNENSSLRYPKTFDSARRIVQLSGDAVFEVTPNPEQAFIVQSEDLAVKVLGTKFNVQARKDQVALVHVLHGKVEVNNQNTPGEKIMLTKGMTAQLDADTKKLQLYNSFSDNQLFWLTRTLHFEQVAFEEVISTLNQAYGVIITVNNTALLSCPVRGIFKDKTLGEILETLQLIYGFEIEKEEASNLQLNNGTCN